MMQGLDSALDTLAQLKEQHSECEAQLQAWSSKCSDGIKALRNHDIVFDHSPDTTAASEISDQYFLKDTSSIHTVDTFFFDQHALSQIRYT